MIINTINKINAAVQAPLIYKTHMNLQVNIAWGDFRLVTVQHVL